MSIALASSIIGIGSTLIDKIFPDKEKQNAERTQAQIALIQAQQEGLFKQTEQQLSAIIAEAQSGDPWTSRARPAFLYLMYGIIGFSLPMGFISAIDYDIAMQIAGGMKAWLGAIPDFLYDTMIIGYLGYTGARTFEKIKINKLR